LELATSRLLRDRAELELRPRAFQALKVLIQNPGRLVDYKQMIREAWDGTQVSHHTIAVTISEIKEVLGEYGSWITCRPKFGYCLEVPKSEDLIRRGWHFWNQYTRVGFENALRCFEQAAQLDEADFRAFEAISGTHLTLAGFLMRAPRDTYGPFLEAHNRAVALSGLTPELRMDRAFAGFVFERRVAEAARELLAVKAERPHSALLYIRLALIYLASGRLEEARAVMMQAQAADALSPELAFLGIVLRLFAREFAAAVEWGRSTLDLHPSSQVGRAFYAEALDHAGRTEEALAQYRLAATLSPDTGWIRADGARCLAVHGRLEEALAILDNLQRNRETEYVDCYHLALLLDALGRRDEAFEELERACEEKSYALAFAALDSKAYGLRGDPRFAHFRERVFGAAC
jgi:DNA-binding winged helix-turn-helix (wHTH) protein/Flp pilus assembly protein TadD